MQPPSVIVLDIEDTDHSALLIGFQAEDQSKLPVEADRTLAAEATFTLKLFEMEALECAQIIFIAGGADHSYFIEEGVYDSRRIPGRTRPSAVELLEFLAGENETQVASHSITERKRFVKTQIHL
jgi:hypothetical protein